MHARHFVLGAVLAVALVIPTIRENTQSAAWAAKSDACLLAANTWVEKQASASVRTGAHALNWLWHQIGVRAYPAGA